MGKIKVWVAIEALAVKKEIVEEALKSHIDRIRKERNIEIVKETFQDALKVEQPTQGVSEAYSQVVEIEFKIDSLRNLSNFVVIYGPSALEILDPAKLEVSASEAQDMLNSISALIHRYASMGVGGVVISTK